MPRHTIEVDAVLFDMDGTLIDSTPAVNAVWQEFCDQYKLDYDKQESCHGWRTIENLRRFVPSLTEEELPKEVERFESRIWQIAEEAKKAGRSDGQILAMPGAKDLLAQINKGRQADKKRRAGWAIVTSATKAYASLGFGASGAATAPPDVFVTSDLCSRGKPDPEPYALGAKMLDVDVRRCLVVEDAPPGAESGKAAGANVLGLRTTHDGQRMWQRGADFVVEDLRKVHARWEGERLVLDIDSEERPM